MALKILSIPFLKMNLNYINTLYHQHNISWFKKIFPLALLFDFSHSPQVVIYFSLMVRNGDFETLSRLSLLVNGRTELKVSFLLPLIIGLSIMINLLKIYVLGHILCQLFHILHRNFLSFAQFLTFIDFNVFL